MADPRPQDTLNPEEVHARQPEEATGDSGNSATDVATDAEVTEVPETIGEPVHTETGDRRRPVPTGHEKHSNEGSMQERHCACSWTIRG